MKKVIAVDGNSLLFKAYYATSFTNMMQTSTGVYTNALFSFINMITKIQKEMEYDYLIVAFDANKTTFRNAQFDGYTQNRSKTPEELVMQFPIVREYLNVAGIPNFEIEGYEADDIIGTLAAMSIKDDYVLDIISSDKDMLQLVDDKVTVCLAVKGISNLNKITPVNLDTIWDITPKQVIDLKGLMGDPSDNIPGVKGVGEKTAIKLLKEHGSVESIYENIDSIKGKLQEKLITDKDNAFLSKQLATIVTDVPLPFTLDDLSPEEIDVANLKDFYHRYELKSLLAKVQNDKEAVCDFTYECITDNFKDILLEDSFIDLVSINEYYHKDIILGLAIVNDKGNYFIKTTDFINDNDVRDFLLNTRKKAYDLKRNILIGYWHDLEIANITDDILISSYLIDSSKKLDANALVDTNFNVSTLDNKSLAKLEKGEQITNKVKQVYYLNKLVSNNQKQLETDGLVDLYALELKIAYLLAGMEEKGILLDKEELAVLDKEFQSKCDELEKAIHAYSNKEFNVNSVKQLGEVLFEDLNLRVIKKTKTGYSTDNDVLNMLIDDHPIIPLIIEYRTYKKLLSTYITPMADFILCDDRVHTIYNQSLTATGRLSSKEPNLQNIATRSELQRSIKKMFIAKEGYSLLSFDYSQIELRILASFSKDPVFFKAFEHDLDIHRITAANVAGIEEDEVSDEQRKAAKAINFGIVYGISDFGLARQLGIMRNDAKDFIEKYYETYPNIKAYLDSLVEDTIKSGYCKTILNRVRYINEIKSNNYNIKEMGKRMAMNTPIQGSAADILKLAMVDVDKAINECDCDVTMLLQVHDELIFEVKDEDLDIIIPMIKNAMENAYKLDIPIKVESGVGKSWYDL